MINYEKFHLDAKNRKSGDYIKVLHPNFKEFGQSGRVFTLKDFLGQSLDENDYEINLFETQELSETSRLCTYTLVNKTNNSMTLRSSVWIMFNGDWKLLFHQGTKTSEK